ncbi:unnamed protein product [Anisakis simplex]|uniref:Fibronectin type-III domain-containing protein n=1 Tax=Anisakis simplex TaxID=6269 RepID=A0A0M3KFK6_ANISI|nr:unnamed protein product [Anisakis simplex]
MWKPPPHFGEPLYYHVRYGKSQMQGIPPFVSWKIVSRREVKTSGTTTSMNVKIDEDADYGVQVCAVYNQQRKKPKFGLARVTPFMCTSCKAIPAKSLGHCGECSKIEGPLLFARRCHPKGGIKCTSPSSLPNSTELDSAAPLQELNMASADSNVVSLSNVPLHIEHSERDNITIIETVAPMIHHSKIVCV